MIPAMYDEELCYLNVDFIIDIFPKNGKYIAYTIDNDRGGYIIDKDIFEMLKEEFLIRRK